jgi:hypothetical protein
MCCNGNRPKVYFAIANDNNDAKIVKVCLGGDAYNGIMAGFGFDNWTTYSGPYMSEDDALANFPDAMSIDDQIELVNGQLRDPIKCPTWVAIALATIGFVIIIHSHGKIKK